MIKLTQFKRSRIVLVLALIIINASLITYLRSYRNVEEININPTPYRIRKLPGVLSKEQLSIFDKSQSKFNKFNKKIEKIYHKKQTDEKKKKKKYDDRHYDVVINEIDKFKKYNYFDPKFTFSVILQYINDNITNHHTLTKQVDFPYFNWNDYVDLSSLNQYRYSPNKLACLEFDQSSNDKLKDINSFIKKNHRYCVEDNDIGKAILEYGVSDELKQKLIHVQAQDRLSTGFHMYRPPGRQSLFGRSIIGKSYVQDFMNPPSSLSLLLPGDDFLKVTINTNDKFKRTRLVESKLFEDLMKRNKKKKKGKYESKFNLKLELNRLLKTLSKVKKSKKKSKQQQKQNHQLSLPYQIELPVTDFINNLDDLPSSLQLTKEFQTSLNVSFKTTKQWRHFEEAYISESEHNHAKGGHMDWRFFNQELLDDTETRKIVKYNLVKAWFKFINRNGFKSWLAHGTLLSWHFNGRTFPWDLDIDVQMSLQEFVQLTNQFNQTIIVDFGNNVKDSPIRYGRYLLDCGTFITHRHKENGANNIDARLIDLDTGLYIDITALSATEQSASEVHCRNEHHYNLTDLNPLKLSLFEGEFTYIPYNYSKILMEEYKSDCLTKLQFRGHKLFHNLWVEEYDYNDEKLIDINVEEYYKSINLIQYHLYETFYPNSDKFHYFGNLDKSITMEYLYDDYYNYKPELDINEELIRIEQEVASTISKEVKRIQLLMNIREGRRKSEKT
ncbi:LicD family-domain-containing protein [Scheffersomyces coipomensis]|uniref:LicD family-domain-containing protein n=1 Tax=Scheffersomyces coipomensis TaxID=1788519 RepID=UPI00315C93FA